MNTNLLLSIKVRSIDVFLARLFPGFIHAPAV